MPKGLLDQNDRLFYLRYDGVQKPIGIVLVAGPIGNPEHYIIKRDAFNDGHFCDEDIAHSYNEAMQKAHDWAITDLSAQTCGVFEDRTSFAKPSQLEQRARQSVATQGCGHSD